MLKNKVIQTIIDEGHCVIVYGSKALKYDHLRINFSVTQFDKTYFNLLETENIVGAVKRCITLNFPAHSVQTVRIDGGITQQLSITLSV